MCPIGGKVLYAVPGVPYEMRDMVLGTVLPDLQVRSGSVSVIGSRVLRTWGHSESGLAEMLSDRITHLDVAGNPTLAFLASGVEGLKVRLTAKAAGTDEVARLLDEEATVVEALLGDLVFSSRDETMEQVVLDLLRADGRTLAIAESITGGFLTGRISATPGAGGVLRGGVVAYDSEVKFDVLGLSPGGVINEDAAMVMADGVRTLLDADVGLATTGVAGPSREEGDEPGTVYIGLAVGDRIDAQRVRLPGDPERVRQFACITALNWLRLVLLGRR